MICDELKAALIAAMKSGDKPGDATIRMIQSAVKNRDIELRTGTAPADDDLLVTEVMQKMIKQRRESDALYRQGGRPELADAEEAEIAIIERFLPQQMSEDEAKAAVAAVIAELGAAQHEGHGPRHGRGESAPRQQHRTGAGERAGESGAGVSHRPLPLAGGARGEGMLAAKRMTAIPHPTGRGNSATNATEAERALWKHA